MAKAAATKTKKSKSYKIDFAGVEERVLIPEGDYKVRPAACVAEEGNEYPYFAWTFEITEGEFEGKKLYTNTSLSPAALWNLRTMLKCMGVEVEDGEMDVSPSELVEDAEEMCVTVEHERYDGRNRPRIIDYYSVDDERATKETKPAKGKEKPGKDKAGKTTKPEADDAPVDPDFDDMDRDELQAFVEANDLEDAVDMDELKTTKKARAAVEAAWEEKKDAAKTTKKPGKEKAGKTAKEEAPEDPEFADMDAEELQAFLEKHDMEDDLDISDMKLKVARAAVVAAWEEKVEEDAKATAKKGKGAAAAKPGKAAKKYDPDDVNAMRVGGLEKLVEKEGIDVELEGLTVSAARKAVVKALRKAGKLEE